MDGDGKLRQQEPRRRIIFEPILAFFLRCHCKGMQRNTHFKPILILQSSKKLDNTNWSRWITMVVFTDIHHLQSYPQAKLLNRWKWVWVALISLCFWHPPIPLCPPTWRSSTLSSKQASLIDPCFTQMVSQTFLYEKLFTHLGDGVWNERKLARLSAVIAHFVMAPVPWRPGPWAQLLLYDGASLTPHGRHSPEMSQQDQMTHKFLTRWFVGTDF